MIGAVVGGAMEAYKQHKAHPDQPLDWGNIAKEAGKGAIVGAVGSGVGILLGSAAAAVAGGAATAGMAALTVGAIAIGAGAFVGAGTAAVEQCVDNTLHDRPLVQDIGVAMGVGAGTGAVTAGIGAIWANRARRLAQAAREAEEAARRAERQTARQLAEATRLAEEKALREATEAARRVKEARRAEGLKRGEEARAAAQKSKAAAAIEKEWRRYNRATDQEFKERLRSFRGNDNLKGEQGMAGSEGQIFLAEQQQERALKRWFQNSPRKFEESVERLHEADRVVQANPSLSKEMDVLRIHEKGSDWIVRDFDRRSVPLKEASAEAEAARQRAMAALRGAEDEMSKDLLKKLEQRSANIHWSPEKQKLLVIDTQ